MLFYSLFFPPNGNLLSFFSISLCKHLNFDIMSKTSTRVRDARTGQFVPKREATRRPATTVTDKVKVGPTKKRR